MIDDEVKLHPRDPLIISVNGYQPWLEHLLNTCIEDYQTSLSELNREVQFAGTARFPERANKRAKQIPWTCIVDQINVPEVYPWSVNQTPRKLYHDGFPHIGGYRFRIGVWTCAREACKFDPNVSVTLLFTQPLEVPESVVSGLLFDYLQSDQDYQRPRLDEEGVCWIFLRLYWLLTDWQNIMRECSLRLDAAEANSHKQNLSVKLRTRTLHREVARMYELQHYLHFHRRAVKKIVKVKPAAPQPGQNDQLWTELEDAADDLEQFDCSLNSLKERFNNLVELEFNLDNASQSDAARFLLIVATVFLPVSFLASVFGMSTLDWPAIWYIWIAVPVFFTSVFLTAIFPLAANLLQKRLYPMEKRHIELYPNEFTMLGDELPDGVDIPSRQGRSKVRSKAPDPAMGRGADAGGYRTKHVHYEKGE